jgi:hypothetical protein
MSHPKKVEPKVEIKTEKKAKWVAIPIVYDESVREKRGRVVYRGLTPRTADIYFRLLKEVSWEEEGERRFSGNLQFESRFESGNLGSAC